MAHNIVYVYENRKKKNVCLAALASMLWASCTDRCYRCVCKCDSLHQKRNVPHSYFCVHWAQYVQYNVSIVVLAILWISKLTFSNCILGVVISEFMCSYSLWFARIIFFYFDVWHFILSWSWSCQAPSCVFGTAPVQGLDIVYIVFPLSLFSYTEMSQRSTRPDP